MVFQFTEKFISHSLLSLFILSVCEEIPSRKEKQLRILLLIELLLLELLLGICKLFVFSFTILTATHILVVAC